MEGIIILLVLGLVVAPIAVAIWAIVQASGAKRQVQELNLRLECLQADIQALRKSGSQAPSTPPAPASPAATSLAATLLEQRVDRTAPLAPISPGAPPAVPPPLPAATTQPFTPTAPASSSPIVADAPPLLEPTPLEWVSQEPTRLEATPTDSVAGASPKPAPTSPTASAPPLVTAGAGAGGPPPRLNLPPMPPTAPKVPSINWENFLGVKLFAWIGGLLLFLGVAFFIKYSFENNLIKPPLRIALGYGTGLALLILGLRMPRERYAVLVQTLCAAAMLIFYGNTFAAHGMYHLIPQLAAFALMTLVTATAFVLAARLNAQVVAVLGMLGGFLTPILLSTGEDRPLGLFTYIALLDLGLLAIALRQRWHYLVLLGWLGTAVMQAGWTGKFYTPEKIVTAMTIYLGFSALFVGGFIAACRAQREEKFITAAALLAPGAALAFAFALVSWPHPNVTDRPALLFSFVLLAVAGWLWLARWRVALRPAHFAGAVAALILLGIWSARAPVLGMLNTAFTLYLLLALLFIGLFALARRKDADDSYSWLAGLAAGGGALAFALYVLGNVSAEAFPKPWLFFSFVFLADAGLLAMAALRERLRPAHLGAGGAVFLLLAIWTSKVVTTALLPWALGLYLLFAILHSVYPVVLEKLRPTKHPLWWAHCFPVAALVLLLIPLMKFAQSPLFIWPVVLLVDLLAIVLAAATASLLAVGAVLVLTLAITGCWIFRVPAEPTSLPQSLLVIGGFAIFFFLASLWAVRKVLPKLATTSGGEGGSATGPDWLRQLTGASPMAHLPAASALLPFLLLIMLTTRLALPDPSPVFGLAALLIVLLLGVVRLYGLGALCIVGLVATFLLETVWHQGHYVRDVGGDGGVGVSGLVLAWHLGFGAVFLVFPFLFRERFRERTAPWVASALALPLHFGLIYGTIKGVWLAGMLGLVPAVLSVPLFAGLVAVLRWLPADAPKRNTLLALFGGAALFFVTLIFPIQFSKQWLTVAWALEGAALLWLFRRVPHPGLRIVGGGLLVVAFLRLALNPAVFDYAARSATPVFNWYLYTYGLVTVALFAGARLLAPPRDRIAAFNLRALLVVLGTVLAFILVNIEIADAFSTGDRIEFRFSGNFARDMSYSLAWAVFAGIMLGVGVRQKLAPARYAGLALLVVTLLKLFLHDVWELEGLYRIGALVGLAIVLLLVPFIYLKFLAPAGKKDEPPTTPPIPPAPPAS